MSSKRQREQVLRVRVSETELSEIAERADRAGLTIGSFVRAALLTSVAPRAVRQPPVNRVIVAEILARLGPVASDIREIAAGGADQNPRIDDALGDLAEIREALMRALGRNP